MRLERNVFVRQNLSNLKMANTGIAVYAQGVLYTYWRVARNLCWYAHLLDNACQLSIPARSATHTRGHRYNEPLIRST